MKISIDFDLTFRLTAARAAHNLSSDNRNHNIHKLVSYVRIYSKWHYEPVSYILSITRGPSAN